VAKIISFWPVVGEVIAFFQQPGKINTPHKTGVKPRVDRGIGGELLKLLVSNVAQTWRKLHAHVKSANEFQHVSQ
jgi:hypothetical protein